MVINGEYTARDNTTKSFFTERKGDPRAYFEVWDWSNCGVTNVGGSGIVFKVREGGVRDGGTICVRPASGGRFELRWSPKGNTVGKYS